MRAKKPIIFLRILLFISGAVVSAQSSYVLVERTDLRRYENNVYKGLVSREVRAFIYATQPPSGLTPGKEYDPGDTWYDGSFYVDEQMKRNASDVTAGIHDAVPAVFRIKNDGRLVMYKDNGYPAFRSFPSFPSDRTPAAGDTWTASGEHACDPFNKGVITRMPVLVQYQCIGKETYRGKEVYRLKAKWATRYGLSYTDPEGDPALKSAQGSNDADILVDCLTRNAVLIRDTVAEEYTYADAGKMLLKGTITLFTEYPPAAPRDSLVPALQRIAEVLPPHADSAPAPDHGPQAFPDSQKNNITVEDTEAGLRLSIQDLQFKPDSAELLPGERDRLDKIAEVLKLAPDSQFLVEGHTASTGKPEGEHRLSEERSHAIAAELVKRGIKAERFICTGRGADKPVADNGTPEGRARNRRVEITILESK